MESELLRISKLISTELLSKTKKWLEYFQKKKILAPDCIAVIDSKELTLEWNRKRSTIFVDLFDNLSLVECSVRFGKNLHNEKVFKNEDESLPYGEVEIWIKKTFEKYE